VASRPVAWVADGCPCGGLLDLPRPRSAESHASIIYDLPLHLVCDLLGSGVQWPIQYFWPFSHTFYYTPYGWELDSWHNITITILAIGVAIRLAVVSGRSFGTAPHFV
jgi:hypothetical protein